MARPAAVAADGNIRIAFATTLTTSAPTAAQCTGGTDLSYYLTAAGFTPNVDQATITDDRLADTQTFEAPGRKTYSLNELQYVFNIPSAGDDAARIALVEGTAGFLVVRWNIASATAFAAAQKIDFWPITVGAPVKMPPEANSVSRIKQKVFVTNSAVFDIALV